MANDDAWFDSARVLFERSTKDGKVVRWSDLLDFYIGLDKERSKETIFQPLHHDGDFKAAQQQLSTISRKDMMIIIKMALC